MIGSKTATSRLAVGRRLVAIASVLARRVVLLGVLRWRAAIRRDSAARQQAAEWLTDTVTRLGPAFVKVAQMLSTRPDLLPPEKCRALASLYDDVSPIPARDLEPALAAALGKQGARAVVEQAAQPVASGSIACVYRATVPDGREVAVKVRRPGICALLEVDLAIMRRAGRLLARLPGLRGMPIAEIVEQLADAVLGQLDFERERRNLQRLNANLVEQPSVRVPRVYEDLCSADVLTMEFVPELRRRTPEQFTPAERDGSVLSALHAMYQMLFRDGLVHCDLHPGNLYLGPGTAVTIVDAGFMVELTQRAQDKFSSFFYYMSVGKGDKCADVVLSTVTSGPRADIEGFRRELTALIAEHTGLAAGEFDLVHFATRLFAIQRRYGLYADPQFVFPILSLLVLEGAVRDFAPAIDFQDEAIPFLAGAMIARTLSMASENAS